MYARNCCVQLCTPPGIVVTKRGPIARAGFSDAFVTGPTVMMIPTTTRPITSPAQPSGERESTMPRIVNSRIAVPIPSISMAEPQVVDGFGPEGTPHRERSDDASGGLRPPIGGNLAPGKALRGRQGERDGRVDVTAGDLSDRVDERDDDQTEGDRDEAEVGARERRLRSAFEQEDRRHGTGADEDEQRRTDELGEQALRDVVLRHSPRPPLGPRQRSRGPFRGIPEASVP